MLGRSFCGTSYVLIFYVVERLLWLTIDSAVTMLEDALTDGVDTAATVRVAQMAE